MLQKCLHQGEGWIPPLVCLELRCNIFLIFNSFSFFQVQRKRLRSTTTCHYHVTTFWSCNPPMWMSLLLRPVRTWRQTSWTASSVSWMRWRRSKRTSEVKCWGWVKAKLLISFWRCWQKIFTFEAKLSGVSPTLITETFGYLHFGLKFSAIYRNILIRWVMNELHFSGILRQCVKGELPTSPFVFLHHIVPN